MKHRDHKYSIIRIKHKLDSPKFYIDRIFCHDVDISSLMDKIHDIIEMYFMFNKNDYWEKYLIVQLMDPTKLLTSVENIKLSNLCCKMTLKKDYADDQLTLIGYELLKEKIISSSYMIKSIMELSFIKLKLDNANRKQLVNNCKNNGIGWKLFNNDMRKSIILHKIKNIIEDYK